jgi:cell division protein FtsI (penicillin-binding protein 3)
VTSATRPVSKTHPRRPLPRPAPKRSPARRLVALLLVFILCLAGIMARLVLLQVRDASAYQELARDQRMRRVALPASRGSIFDRTGQELAMSLPATAVFADPQLIQKRASTARTVARALDLRYRDVFAKLSRPGRFVYLARGVTAAGADALRRRHLPGIGFHSESRRHYPARDLAPQVLGFVGVDGNGLAGLELQYERRLAGRAGHVVVESGPQGIQIPQGTSLDVPPVAGDGLVLTIDEDIQYRAQEALAAAVKANHAKGGTVIVMDPGSGEILAMADYPWFDPNRFREAKAGYFRNRAVTDVYEPGSVNKVVTAVAALEEGVLKLKERLRVEDRYTMSGKTFTDAHPHSPQDMTLGDVIAYSSNIGAIQVAERLGKERLYAYLQRFGLTERTGVDFPGESPGILPPPEEWWGPGLGTIAIGQGIAVTPLQMATVYATIANGGVWVQPRFVRGTVGNDGRFVSAPAPISRRVVSERTARVLARMLAYAVDVGTGRQAQIDRFWVAGKTGTARKPLEDAAGYGDKHVASFIGFVPSSRPALVVAAVLDEPETVFGGVAAAPVFRDVARFALARLRIPPAPKFRPPPHAVPLPAA